MARNGGSLAGRRAVLASARHLAEAAAAVTADHAVAVGEVRGALRPIREELAGRELRAIPVARLKDVTQGRLRLAHIEAAGFRTVGEVLAAGRHALRQVPGVGPQTADQALAAAGQIARVVEESVAVRIDPDDRDPRTGALLVALHRLVEAGPETRRAVGVAGALGAQTAQLLERAAPAAGRWRMWLAGQAAREQAVAAVEELAELCERARRGGVPTLLGQASVDLLRGPADPVEAWVDFEIRSAEYYGLLAEISERGPDPAAAEGFLPSEVAERVRAQPLDDSRLRVSLRGYQSFGARFALAQRRVIIGDEMGLGKTIQALAALAHLAAAGRTHFLVVCPAGVLVNWTREIGARTTLRAVVLHGPDRHAAYEEWRRDGGVGVTTYDALRGFAAPGAETGPGPAGAGQDAAAGKATVQIAAVAADFGTELAAPAAGPASASGPAVAVAMLVVDEAHYVKNPETRRSQAVAGWIAGSERVLFLTGTPMENRVSEFRSLVHYLRPELVPAVGVAEGAAGSQAFRAAVAPAYLRRNQQEVLTELPSLAHTDEWQELSASDQDAYRDAVLAGNFMAMRRAAYARPEKSAKLRRLCELVAEAEHGGLKVVVFSYFRDVLAAVGQALDAAASHGPLSGSVPPVARQRIVDEFTAAPGHAVLLAQIEAGGVGLNLQAASVVIICEPQVKPTVENQAVARAHRMGQVRQVQVHRLLATTGVDQRLLAILGNKSRLFDAYARRSDTAEATPDAVDVSDGSLARQIVEDEQRRLAAVAPEPA